MHRIILAIAVCLIAVGSATTLRAATAGAPAPAFELITFAGESYSNVSTKGRPMLLVFWAPWCNVCQRDLPQLTEFYQERAGPPRAAKCRMFPLTCEKEYSLAFQMGLEQKTAEHPKVRQLYCMRF